MSHYGVLVIGGNVEEQLAPYHEYESTGRDDRYVQEVDQTEEAREQYAKSTTTRYKDPEGNLHDPFTPEGNWNQKFWRELTSLEEIKYGKRAFHQDHRDNPDHGGLRLYSTDWHDGQPYHTKAFAWPSEGWTEVQVLKNTVETFAEFCDGYYGHKVVPFGEQPNFSVDREKETSNHKYGYTIVDEKGEVVKTVDRTNPSAKWDWYGIGGRYNGFFKLKALAVGVLGEPGLQTMNEDYEPATPDRADILMKGDIDVEGMREEASAEADKRYSMYDLVSYGTSVPLSWKQMQEKHQTGEVDERGEPKVDWAAARNEYGDQPRIKALRARKETMWFEADDYLGGREAYVQRFRDSALTLFAVVKDGKWYERGEMGWWGMVSNEQDRAEWNRQFSALIDELPDNTLLTVVDCHI